MYRNYCCLSLGVLIGIELGLCSHLPAGIIEVKGHYKQVVAGSNITLSLREDGSLVAWGLEL